MFLFRYIFYISFAFVPLVTVVLYLTDVPLINLGGDELEKWKLAKALCLDLESNFNSKSHHHLRWGTWVSAYIGCKFFGSSPQTLLIASIIPPFIAQVSFSWLIWRRFGVFCGVVFNFLWVSNPELGYITRQLFSSSQGMVWLVVAVFLLRKIYDLDTFSYKYCILLALVCFVLYGVKLPFVFFIPGVLLICWYKFPKYCLVILCVGGGLYLVETLVLFFVTDGVILFGRLEALLIDGRHVRGMSSARIISEHQGLFDRGLFTRWWHRSYGVQFTVYVLSAVISLYFFHRFWKLRCRLSDSQQVVFICAVLFLSFSFFTTFFIISFDPLTLGQPAKPRYLAIALPLCFLLIAYGITVALRAKGSLLFKGVLVMWCLIFVSPSIDQTIVEKKNYYLSMDSINDHYESVGTVECIQFGNPKRLHYYKEIYRYWDDDVLHLLESEPVVHRENGRKILYIPGHCSNPFKAF